MHSTDLTVAALVEADGRFLIVEETVSGRRVLTQPGGHIENGESPEDAARREVIEEAGVTVVVRDLVGAYQWQDADCRQFLRIVFLADLQGSADGVATDDTIHAVHWLSYAELVARQEKLRSSSVLRCIDDYLAGERQPRGLFAGCEHPEEQIHAALARAELLNA